MNAPRSALVSVIVPTHNRAGMLCRAIDSVLNQTFTDFELIVVDDGSTDDTAERVVAYTDARLCYFKHPESRGASAARNTGIHHARGRYIAFLDDDDEWLPVKLEKQVPLLQRAPEEVGLVYCWMDYYENGRLVNEVHPTLRGYVIDQVLDSQRLGGCPTLLVRREVVEDIGGFDESLPRGNDGDFIRRVCLKYHVDVVPEVLVRVYVGHDHRISAMDQNGLRNAIRGEQAKLEKFGPQLARRPELRAAILRKIASHWRELGKLERANQLLLEAARLEGKSAFWLRRTYMLLPSIMQPIARRAYQKVRALPRRIASHAALLRQRLLDRYKLNDLDQLYEEEWFAGRKEGVWYEDTRHFCAVMWEQFAPQSVADVGCGPGVYLKCLAELGTQQLLGLEGADNALKQAVVPDILKHDLREPFHHPDTYELVLCLEVAEHIHAVHAGTLLDTVVNLCRPGGTIVFTAAPPGQGGVENHHINLQPKTYWIGKFADRGCQYDEQLTRALRGQLEFNHLHWIKQNLTIFRKCQIQGAERA